MNPIKLPNSVSKMYKIKLLGRPVSWLDGKTIIRGYEYKGKFYQEK